GRVISGAFLPDGRRVVSVGGPGGDGRPGEVRLWDAQTGEEIRQFKGHQHEVRVVVALPDGKRILTTGQDRLTILWDVATGQPLRRVQGPDKSSAVGLRVGPDGRHAVLPCWDG